MNCQDVLTFVLNVGSLDENCDQTYDQTCQQPSKFRYRKRRDSLTKPKNRSAYMIFTADIRDEMKRKGTPLRGNQSVVYISQLWRNLTVEDHKKYEAKAAAEKTTYQEWKAKNPLQTPRNRTQKNHVKKFTTAYGFYAKETFQKVKQCHPELYSDAIYRMIGQMWKSLDEGGRAPYQKMAEEDKITKREKLQRCEANLICGSKRTLKLERIPMQDTLIKKARLDLQSCAQENTDEWMNSLVLSEIFPVDDNYPLSPASPIVKRIESSDYNFGLFINMDKIVSDPDELELPYFIDVIKIDFYDPFNDSPCTPNNYGDLSNDLFGNFEDDWRYWPNLPQFL